MEELDNKMQFEMLELYTESNDPWVRKNANLIRDILASQFDAEMERELILDIIRMEQIDEMANMSILKSDFIKIVHLIAKIV